MGSKRVVGVLIRSGSRPSFLSNYFMFSRSKPTLYHALVVIFLEFFAWGLLTLPMINALDKTFPDHTFLINGLIFGLKGILSFMSAPLIGGLSDLWGRKFFLLITVFFTCLPIPFLKISPITYFCLIAFSGIFAVTFSIVFAYVADFTSDQERSFAYGSVSATFALSIVTSPALGGYLSDRYGDELVTLIATIIAIFDFVFILFFVPESLPEKLRQKSISFWETADPCASIRRAAGKDSMILTLCVAVFLSYLPEAGQYSCFFVYLKLVIGFSSTEVALFIAIVGILSVISQTILLSALMRKFGSKNTIMIGLIFEMLQLICYGLGSQRWVIWGAGFIVALSSITYPAISAYVSNYADADKQGLVQGIITGIRCLCSGLGPAAFGLVFSLFNVDLIHHQNSSLSDIKPAKYYGTPTISANISRPNIFHHIFNTSNVIFDLPNDQLIPGPPFLFGALLVLLAILVTAFIPELTQFGPSNQHHSDSSSIKSGVSRVTSIISPSRSSNAGNYYYKNIHHQKNEETHCSQTTSDVDSTNVKFLSAPRYESNDSHSSLVNAMSSSAASSSSSEDEEVLLIRHPSISSATKPPSISLSNSPINCSSIHDVHRSKSRFESFAETVQQTDELVNDYGPAQLSLSHSQQHQLHHHHNSASQKSSFQSSFHHHPHNQRQSNYSGTTTITTTAIPPPQPPTTITINHHQEALSSEHHDQPSSPESHGPISAKLLHSGTNRHHHHQPTHNNHHYHELYKPLLQTVET